MLNLNYTGPHIFLKHYGHLNMLNGILVSHTLEIFTLIIILVKWGEKMKFDAFLWYIWESNRFELIWSVFPWATLKFIKDHKNTRYRLKSSSVVSACPDNAFCCFYKITYQPWTIEHNWLGGVNLFIYCGTSRLIVHPAPPLYRVSADLLCAGPDCLLL